MSRAPVPLDESVSSRMRSQRVRDTEPEQLLVNALRSRGYKVETHVRDLPGSPDIVLRRRKTAIFVHGCFWHGCPWHYSAPRNNGKWWEEKINANKLRDRKKAAALRRDGWLVINIWEHVDAELAVSRIKKRISATTTARIR